MKAPTEEAKMAAVEARQVIFRALEAMIENDWSYALDGLESAKMLIIHCQRIDQSFEAAEDAE